MYENVEPCWKFVERAVGHVFYCEKMDSNPKDMGWPLLITITTTISGSSSSISRSRSRSGSSSSISAIRVVEC